MSTHYPILTALSLPAVSTFPAADCIQWSGDGQAVLITRNAIYILTPETGISVDSSSIIKQNLDRSLTLSSQKPIGWLRTMIEGDKGSNMYQWLANLQAHEWVTASLGSMDLSFTSVACSPSNVSSNAGCIYAVLDSNSEVILYQGVKNPITGQWARIGDLHVVLGEVAEPLGEDREGDARKILRVLHRQSTCVSWSSQANFGRSPAPDLDGSLLAVGNRAGCINLLRFNRDASSPEHFMQHVFSVTMSERWITYAAWSLPVCISPGKSQSYLACASADGSVVVVAIEQTLEQRSDNPAFIPEYDIAVKLDERDEQVIGADNRGITSLRWINTKQSEPILVFTKPGLVYLWCKPSAFMPWSDLRTFRLETQKLSVGSTGFSRASGIVYSQRRDVLTVTLADGSFHVIQAVSTVPSLVSQGDSDLSSSSVSKVARSVFSKVEEEEVTKSDVNAIHGLTSYDGDAFYTWIHESTQPNDFSYKHDAKHSHMIVTAQLWNSKTDDEIMEDIHTTLSECKASSGESPLSSLRPIFLSLRDRDRLTRLHARVLELLQSAHEPAPTAPALQPWTGTADATLRAQFERSLRTHLFGQDAFLARRMRVLLAGFCQKQSEDGGAREAYAQAAGAVVGAMWPEVLRIVVRHVVAVAGVLVAEDIPFVLRIIVQALLVGTPEDVQAEANALRAQILQMIPAEGSLGLDEQCPACHSPVALNDITTATCANGHIWARCSVTSFILATPMVRTCMGCKRKAFLPPPPDAPSPPSWLPPSAHSWVAQALLQAVRRCLFCGCNFVMLA